MPKLTKQIIESKRESREQCGQVAAVKLPARLRELANNLHKWTRPVELGDEYIPEGARGNGRQIALLNDAAEGLELLERLLKRERQMGAEMQARLDVLNVVATNYTGGWPEHVVVKAEQAREVINRRDE